MTARLIPVRVPPRRRALRTASRQAIAGKPLDLEPVSLRRLFLRFAVAGVLAVTAVSIVSTRLSRDAALDIAISQALDRSHEDLEQFVAPLLVDGVVDGDPAALDALDTAVTTDLLHGTLESIKVWAADGTILYASDERLRGVQFELDEGVAAALDAERPFAEDSDLSAPENVYDPAGRMIEIYIPTETIEGTPVLYETYHRRSDLVAVGDEISSRFIVIAVIAVAVVELVQLPLALQMMRRLRSGLHSRGKLLSGAMAAADAERRRIAGDLHGGALQELVGSSMSLAAVRSADASDPALDAVGDGLARGVGSLRSLLYDLPSVAGAPADDDIESSMSLLLRRFDGTDAHAQLNFATDGMPIDAALSSLLTRTTSELVREVADTTSITSVRLDVECHAGSIDLLLSDDRDVAATSATNGTPTDSEVVVALGELIDASGGYLAAGCGLTEGRWTRVHLPAIRP